MGNSVSETVMDDYARGIATFNSCDKAGSIPFFTRHLEAHPDHYNARMWRARAYGIVGDKANCLADLQIAKEKSSGVHQLMAELEIAEVQNKADEFLSILQNVINEYPHHAAGWSRFARFVHKYLEMDDDKALNLFLKAVEVAEANNQTDIPEYPWLNNYLGDVYHKNGNLELAEQYYKAAIRAASTLTIAHCGLSRVYLQKNNLEEARKCYDTARQLNPKLVHWEKFEAFRLAGVRNQTASDGNRKFTDSKKKGKKGQSGGGSDGSDGSDSDDQNTDSWRKLVAQAQAKAMYRGKVLVLSKCEKYWYSKDTAGHGGSYVKVYKNRGNTLEFLHAADENLKPISSKHESHAGEIIKKCDLNMKRQK